MQSRAAKGVLVIIAAITVFLAVNAVITVFSAYHPQETEPVAFVGEEQKTKLSSDKIKILTFNTGHGALGAESDLKKEGGSGRRVSTDVILKNVRGISEIVNLSSADVVLLQDVDVDSYRSRYVDQYSYYLGNGSYIGAFALDFSTRSTSLLPPYKKVQSGLLTLSRKSVLSANRVSLPAGFSGLPSSVNPKRAMLVTEFEIEGGNKKLTLINLELDAYTSSEKREEQIIAVIDYAEKSAQNGDYVIAGGSFYSCFDNTAERYPLNDRNKWEPGEFAFDKLPDGWSLVYDAAVPTARLLNAPYDSEAAQEERQVYVADGYIASPNVEIKMIVTVDQEFRYSAHNPVLLEIALK